MTYTLTKKELEVLETVMGIEHEEPTNEDSSVMSQKVDGDNVTIHIDESFMLDMLQLDNFKLLMREIKSLTDDCMNNIETKKQVKPVLEKYNLI